MLDIFLTRLKQGHQTIKFPDAPAPKLPERFRGRPMISRDKCPSGCAKCAEACPTNAISLNGSAKIDLGRCLFCTDCVDACANSAIAHAKDHRLSVRRREDLFTDDRVLQLAAQLDAKSRRLFGRSLKLRQVSAGGCNACEADVNVLNTIGWDLGRFGIQFVASPRHADGILVTGPVSQNMKLALLKTYDAVPTPKLVIAVGACAISGGPFLGHEQTAGPLDGLLGVDLYIPGCPPHPLTTLDGLLRLLGRIDDPIGRT